MKIRARYVSAVMLAATAALALPSIQASAAVGQPAVPSVQAALAASQATAAPDVSSTVAPSWQTNSTVWALASANGVVYVGGQFTSTRPPGAPAGTGEVARTYLAAYSSRTGALQSFNPSITGGSGAKITALAVSPDGSTLYVGGNFNHVNGTYRDNLAAFSTATGTLTSWAPTAYGNVNTIVPSPSGSEIYLGGAFNALDGSPRTYAGAVNASGALQPWAPNLNNAVTSLAVAPDDSRVFVGGYFTTINGVTQNAIGSTDPGSGASDPFAATIVPNYPGCSASVKDIVVSGTTVYIASEGTGGGCFDGDFAANISDGSLVWQNDCLGATQSIAVVNGWLFKGSHAHDCAYSAGGFPQVNSGSGWVTHHLLDQSLTDGSIGHWTPDTSSTAGGLGPRVMATDGSQLFLGGDFYSVNGTPQQGFARFAAGPDPQYPTRPVAPTAISTSAGVDSVTFPATSSRATGTLTYTIYRDGSRTPIGTVTATSWPWALPVLHFRDAGLTPGSQHTYTVTATDGNLITAQSAASAPVTVASLSPSLSYQQTVLADNPSFLWPLNDTSGSAANDASPHGLAGIYEPGTTQGLPGPITGAPDTATGFDGKAGLVTSANQVTNPQTFSVEAWFKTSTNTGGKLVGFGNAQTGMSSSYDRQVYMMNDGQLVFGVYSGGVQTIETPNVFNDGQWHHVVATLGPAGMALYVDGQLTGTKSVTSAQGYDGYWRVGGDNLNGWNLDPWGSNSQGTTEPNSFYFQGSVADVAVFPNALSAAQIAAHYAANALSH